MKPQIINSIFYSKRQIAQICNSTVYQLNAFLPDDLQETTGWNEKGKKRVAKKITQESAYSIIKWRYRLFSDEDIKKLLYGFVL